MLARDLGYRTQRVTGKFANIAASILFSASFRSYYPMAIPVNYTKIQEHLRVSYQAHQLHIPESLCLFLEHKTLWYGAYFDGLLVLFAKALLY
jgi:hypothetical protein